MNCLSIPRWLLLLALLALLTSGPGSENVGLAQSIRSGLRPLPAGLRSLDFYQGRQVDELDRPGIEERQSQLGWELRGPQITVRARTSREDAVWAMQQAQVAWQRMSQQADYWTRVHRRDDFGVGAVSIVIDDRPTRELTPSDPVVRDVDGVSLIYINVAPGQPTLEEQQERLAFGTALSLLHVARFHDKLPRWAQVGMAADVAGIPLTLEPPGENQAVHAPPAGRVPAEPTRDGHVSFKPGQFNQANAAAWFRYLLTGDDAQHAPEMFAALEATLADSNEQLQVAPYDDVDQLRARRLTSVPDAGVDWTPLDEMIRQHRLTHTIGSWLDDPLVDQPLPVDKEGKALPQLSGRQREMIVLLKLAKRMNVSPPQVVRQKIVGWTAEGAQDLSQPAPESLPIDLSAMQQTWMASSPQQATLDTNATLLLSGDEARVAELFQPVDGAYEVRQQGERQVLVFTDRLGHQQSAWLETNKENPRRPWVKFQQQGDAD